MAAYQSFTSTRTTTPDAVGLLVALRAAVAPELGMAQFDPQHYTLKKASAWLPGEITAAQNTIDTAAAATPQLTAQHVIDAMTIFDKARDLALIDQLNVIRGDITALGINRPAITVPQAIAAIRAKAGTL